ncbi:MAG: ribokinase [Candidatus Geothermincolia bacterium]
MAGVLVVGSLNLDMVITVPYIPRPGENVHGTGFTMVAGGKGGNQALAAARMQQESYLRACVGTDAFGDFLIESLESGGVNTELVKQTDAVNTGIALIAVEDGSGMNTIVVDPGANMAMTKDDLDVLDACYDRCGAALFQLEIPLDVVAEGAVRAREHGLMTLLDAGPPRGADLELVRLFDVVSPNERELGALTGREISGVDSAVAAARELVDVGVETVVVKMGEAGALLVTRDLARVFPAFDIPAVDSTGAGDAFTAGLAVALCEGMCLEEATVFANAAGARAVMVLGAQPSMPSREEVLDLLERGGSS